MTISGLAGSGKTFITLMSAYALVQAGYYSRIVITRNVQPVGRDIGFLPGSADEKMSPWLAPIMDNFRVGLKDNNLSLFNTLKEQGIIEVAPLSFIRGRTFNDSILIMDEAQNATIHELKTVITRMGENSKIILLGDKGGLKYVNFYRHFFKNLIFDLGWFFIPFAVFVITGSSNAVNLTDGLDGLATVPVLSLIHI